MNRLLMIVLLLMLCAADAPAQKNQGSIQVSPNGVNVNADGATTVFLTFGGLGDRRPAEATWCGDLIPAGPGVGFKCDPTTVYGSLPERYDLSTPSGRAALTDVMSIPPSVARRAYQDAQDGVKSSFYYVRRFVSSGGGPDEYVFVTCRMAGGGVGVPFALTGVRLAFGDDLPLVLTNPGERLPPVKAEIAYNGSGRLAGVWEVVMPGDELPTEHDLLTEATLPAERRGRQRRYTQLQRFNVFLPPTGKYTLPGPDASRLPTHVEGAYQVLLRVEVNDDQDGGTNLAAVGAGPGFIQSGAVAGFPLPTLRYFVGGAGGAPGASPGPARASAWGGSASLTPAADAVIARDQPILFTWNKSPEAALYRLEICDENGKPVLSALRRGGNSSYRLPPWLPELGGTGQLRWRVLMFDQRGAQAGESPWRRMTLAAPPGR
jgi:hypothetical protein